MGKRDKSGRFKRIHKLWTFNKWTDGYIDNKRRFRVYRPDYPGSYSEGYALRAHIVWWLKTGKVCSPKMELHHIDRNTLNDSFENLSFLTRSQHRKIHQGRDKTIICKNCKKNFIIPYHKFRSRHTKFCSQKCYHKFPRSAYHRNAISLGMKKAYLNKKYN